MTLGCLPIAPSSRRLYKCCDGLKIIGLKKLPLCERYSEPGLQITSRPPPCRSACRDARHFWRKPTPSSCASAVLTSQVPAGCFGINFMLSRTCRTFHLDLCDTAGRRARGITPQPTLAGNRGGHPRCFRLLTMMSSPLPRLQNLTSFPLLEAVTLTSRMPLAGSVWEVAE